MKTSTRAAAGAGALTAGVGIVAAFLCPFAGLAVGAYFTYGAAVSAGFPALATVALGAAGGVGGLALGLVAREVVAVCSLVAGTFTGIGVKLFGSLFEKHGQAERTGAENGSCCGIKQQADGEVKDFGPVQGQQQEPRQR